MPQRESDYGLEVEWDECCKSGNEVTAVTIAARRVLNDCEAVLDMLEDEEHEQRWRILWVAAMALVRSVGHVLRNVDREDPQAQPLIDVAWDRWHAERSANEIFWEFIENERNNILKEYQFSVLDSAVVGLAVVDGSEESGHALAYETLPDNLFRPVEPRIRHGGGCKGRLSRRAPVVGR